MLETVSSEKECKIYRIETDAECTSEEYIATTPGTRAICNDSALAGVDYTLALKNSCSDILKGLKTSGVLNMDEKDTIVFNVLRGGLNFGLREALASAYDWNRHGSAFISAQRVRKSRNSEEWHITESHYKKVYVPDNAWVVIGDVVATGTSLEYAMQELSRAVEQSGSQLKGILFFTYGGRRSGEIISRTDKICRDRFPAYEKSVLVYLEGCFEVPGSATPLSIKITGTDLIRYQSLLAPEFIDSQYEDPAYPLERCAIYDAGSRAFWLPEYLADVHSYWTQTKNLAEKMSFCDLLKERMPRLDCERFGKVDLRELCDRQISKIAELMD
ncbi:hypothetical protein P0136_12795 [Lentisphaerota bacterium ZTH]|nr:hypothetical protein JYG24_09690 [Lentisphaerota bacterium]WET06235.1 hypothetical protein P0136_12795 [Lentisphaerota bacterium ZTH]